MSVYLPKFSDDVTSVGLLGTLDGNPDNNLTKRDGTELTSPDQLSEAEVFTYGMDCKKSFRSTCMLMVYRCCGEACCKRIFISTIGYKVLPFTE